MAGTLAAQFKQQQGSADLAVDVVNFVCDVMKPSRPKTALEQFLAVCEFFARECRTTGGGE
jgi:hypothetical protein